MNRENLKNAVNPNIERLEKLQRHLARVIDLAKRSCEQGDGTHGSVMQSIALLKENADFPKSMHPIVNAMHKAFYLDAQRNFEDSIRAQREALEAHKPAAFAPKRKRNLSTEIENPDALLAAQ